MLVGLCRFLRNSSSGKGASGHCEFGERKMSDLDFGCTCIVDDRVQGGRSKPHAKRMKNDKDGY
eukprot:IDg11639t1